MSVAWKAQHTRKQPKFTQFFFFLCFFWGGRGLWVPPPPLSKPLGNSHCGLKNGKIEPRPVAKTEGDRGEGPGAQMSVTETCDTVTPLQVAVQTGIVKQLKAELAEVVAGSAAQKLQVQQHVASLVHQLAVARAETEEAVQAGNSQYMVLVAQHAQREEQVQAERTELTAALESAQADFVARSGTTHFKLTAPHHLLSLTACLACVLVKEGRNK